MASAGRKNTFVEYVRLYGEEMEKVRSGGRSWSSWASSPERHSRLYPGKKAFFMPSGDIRDRYGSEYVPGEGFIKENVDYYAVNRVLDLLNEEGISDSQIARSCNLDGANVTHWRKGRKDGSVQRPQKYQWWAVAVSCQLPVELLPAFLLMVGAVYEPARIEDQIIYAQMKKGGADCSRAFVRDALQQAMKNKLLVLDEKTKKEVLDPFLLRPAKGKKQE